MSQAGTEIRHYLKGIEKTLQSRNATEHTYRSNLKGLLETLFPAVTATNEPKRITCGAPDYIITNKQIPLGYIETKDIGVSLDHFETDELLNTPNGRQHNLVPTFTTNFSKKLNVHFIQDGKGDLQETFGPEDIFDYMYAIFHSPTYRARYAEFLKRDFPRLPLTSNTDLLRDVCAIGARLVALHLMEHYGEHLPKYPEPGNNMVEKVEYTQPAEKPEQGRVWINKTQYFDRVLPEVWEFHVGGYRVCQKWLKDRKGRTLTYDERKHYQRIVGALFETITLMEQIDEVIDKRGGWPIE